MNIDLKPAPAIPVAGLFPGLAELSRNSIGLLLSRFQLGALELADVRSQLLKLALVAALAMLALWFAVGYGTVLLVYLTWNVLGWKILLLIAIALAAAGTTLLFYAWTLTRHGKLSLTSTMAELRADRDALL